MEIIDRLVAAPQQDEDVLPLGMTIETGGSDFNNSDRGTNNEDIFETLQRIHLQMSEISAHQMALLIHSCKKKKKWFRKRCTKREREERK